MMKYLAYIFLLCCFSLRLSAQGVDENKPSTLVFHVFYDDFRTARQINFNSLNNVFKKNSWTNIGDMQMGFGFNYLKGINPNIDFTATLDANSADYLFKDGTTNGSSKLLLDANAGLNIKLLTDRYTVVPYLFGGAGFSIYKGKPGAYIPLGLGIQVNVFNEAFIFTNAQYKQSITAEVSNHFYYSVGVGTSIGKKRKAKLPVPEVIPQAPVVQVAKTKNIIVTVTDEQTALPLPGVEIILNGNSGNMTAVTNADGQVIFNAVANANYSISGTFNNIATSSGAVSNTDFDTAVPSIQVNITHNDPRFTLSGIVANKTTNNPEGNVMVSVDNITQNSVVTQQSQPDDGAFTIQLEAESDFNISAQKAAYISNIEKLSTKGLKRSETLYVLLQLDIEEVLPGKTIALSNIYYDTGSATVRAGASSDLQKLVKFLKDNPNLKIEIAAHTDSRGSAARNLALSKARAAQIVVYLQKNGISTSRLTAKGYGETRLINGCKNGVVCTEAAHQQNRRTEFKVIN